MNGATLSHLQTLFHWYATSPLFGITATLAVYFVSYRIWARSHLSPLCHPVMLSVLSLGGLLLLTGVPYSDYMIGGQVLQIILGPATVALAIPLYRQMDAIRRSMGAIGVALAVGCVVGIVSSVWVAAGLHAAPQVILSLAPKSVTAPIAMGIADQIGGIPSLAAALVVAAGLFGAAFGPRLLDLFRITDRRARGLGMGIAAHGIGTARALQSSEEEGAFASMGMGLNGLASAIIIPQIIRFLIGG